MTDEEIIEITKKWINGFVISYNICPFAKYSFHEDNITYNVNHSPTSDPALFGLSLFLHELSINFDTFSNAFFILPYWKGSFNVFLDYTEMGYAVLDDLNLSETFQLVAFHPEFHYQNESVEDVTSLTNQSPFPMIHILKVEEVSQAIDSFDQPEHIPINNQKLLTNLSKSGIKKIKALKTNG